MVDQFTSPALLNAAITSLKFFFETTAGHAELMPRMQSVRDPRPNYLAKGRTRRKMLTFSAHEFMSRFLPTKIDERD